MGEKDKSVRGAFKNKHLFLEFIRKYVKQLKEYKIKEEDLEWIDPNTISPDLSEKSGDVFYKLRIEEKSIYIYVALEHKSSVEYDTVMQTMFYTFRIWEQEYKKSGTAGETKDYKLPAVLMVLFYEGEENWTASLDFREKIEKVKGYNPFKLNIIDLKDVKEEDLLKSREAIDYFILLRKPNTYNLNIKMIIEKAREMLDDVEWATFIEFLYSKVRDEFTEEEIEEIRNNRGGEEVMGLLERAFYNARKEGKDEGIKEGIKDLLEIKFGKIGLRVMENIKKIGDLGKLESIKEIIKKASDIKEVEKVVYEI